MTYFNEISSNNLLSNLPLHNKLIIWAAREWLNNIRLAKDPRYSLIKGFSQVFIQEAVYHFDKFMRTTACNAEGKIDIRSPCCLVVGEGEEDLLACLSFSQGGFDNFQKIILGSFIRDDSIQNAKNSIDEVAKSFSKSGYFFDIEDTYLRKVKADPNDFKNVILNQFNKNDFMKYYL